MVVILAYCLLLHATTATKIKPGKTITKFYSRIEPAATGGGCGCFFVMVAVVLRRRRILLYYHSVLHGSWFYIIVDERV